MRTLNVKPEKHTDTKRKSSEIRQIKKISTGEKIYDDLAVNKTRCVLKSFNFETKEFHI